MALNPDELFEILNKGFVRLDQGVTDKTHRMEMRMEKMRKRLAQEAEKTRLSLDKKLSKFEDVHIKVPDKNKRRKASNGFKFMMTITFLLFFTMGLIFIWSIAYQRSSPQTQTPPPLPAVEETVNKKL